MILKKFFGETVEDAKKQAISRYGRNFVVMETFPAEGSQQAGITIAVDLPEVAPAATAPATNEGGFRNVFYKRSGSLRDVGMPASSSSGSTLAAASTERSGASAATTRLQRLRSLAETEVDAVRTPLSPSPGRRFNMNGNQAAMATSVAPADRKVAFAPSAGTGMKLAAGNHVATHPATHPASAHPAATHPAATHPAATHPAAAHPASASPPPAEPKTLSTPYGTAWSGSDAHATTDALVRAQRDLAAMNKRFDRIEAMMDSSLMTANLNMVAHPIFLQLIQTGIQPVTVSQWFRRIIARGVDPSTQSEAFMAQISEIIRLALDRAASDRPDRIVLFTGPSGSGKTTLIMKLILARLAERRAAVVALLPDGDESASYFTILEPFCRQHGISYYPVTNSSEVGALREELSSYEQVYIDTPSLPMQHDKAFRRYWELRQLFTSLGSFEAHYVVNAAMSRLYFEDPAASHHPLQPDFVAITHLDEVDKLGPIIPFMEGMACKSRWVSWSASLGSGVAPYDPAWFARKILREI